MQMVPSTSFDSPKLLTAIEEFNRQNYFGAIELLDPIAHEGNPRARCYLASAYQCLVGPQENGQKVVDLYLSVAVLNITEDRLSGLAYNNLATIYFTGIPGITRDLQKGEEYQRRARELGFGM
jgi:TPR repeat protein